MRFDTEELSSAHSDSIVGDTPDTVKKRGIPAERSDLTAAENLVFPGQEMDLEMNRVVGSNLERE